MDDSSSFVCHFLLLAHIHCRVVPISSIQGRTHTYIQVHSIMAENTGKTATTNGGKRKIEKQKSYSPRNTVERRQACRMALCRCFLPPSVVVQEKIRENTRHPRGPGYPSSSFPSGIFFGTGKRFPQCKHKNQTEELK